MAASQGRTTAIECIHPDCWPLRPDRMCDGSKQQSFTSRVSFDDVKSEDSFESEVP